MAEISTWEAIKAFIVSLPKLIDAFARIGKVLADKQFQDWVTELNSVATQTENAKTPEERIAAARAWDRIAKRM